MKVTTTEKEHDFIIAVDYNVILNKNAPSFLEIIGDDDWKDGKKVIHNFVLENVVDWEEPAQ